MRRYHIDRSFVAADGLGDEVEGRLEHRQGLLRIVLGGGREGGPEIGAQHRDLLALTWGRRLVDALKRRVGGIAGPWGCLRRHTLVGRNRRRARHRYDRHIDEVTTSWHGLDDVLLAVTQRPAHIADAARQRLIAHRRVGPYRSHHLVLADDPAWVFE